jgi:hypothetical protein
MADPYPIEPGWWVIERESDGGFSVLYRTEVGTWQICTQLSRRGLPRGWRLGPRVDELLAARDAAWKEIGDA